MFKSGGDARQESFGFPRLHHPLHTPLDDLTKALETFLDLRFSDIENRLFGFFKEPLGIFLLLKAQFRNVRTL